MNITFIRAGVRIGLEYLVGNHLEVNVNEWVHDGLKEFGLLDADPNDPSVILRVRADLVAFLWRQCYRPGADGLWRYSEAAFNEAAELVLTHCPEFRNQRRNEAGQLVGDIEMPDEAGEHIETYTVGGECDNGAARDVAQMVYGLYCYDDPYEREHLLARVKQLKY